jgi:cobalt-zinc-cadmium efflux system protein
MHHHPPHRGHRTGSERAFALATLVNLGYTVLEAFYGFLTGSLALLSDAVHNLGDVLGLALAWGAARLASRLPTASHTYGWRRATLLAPLANALLLTGFSGALAWEAVRRFAAPPEIPAWPVIWVAAIGVAVNVGTALLFHANRKQDLNRRGAYLHLMSDAGVSVAAVLAGLGMYYCGWYLLDPLLAVLVATVVAIAGWKLLLESFRQVMDAVPAHIDHAAVLAWLAQQPGVSQVHHLHIWAIGSGEVALTAHLVRPGEADHDDFLDDTLSGLESRFGINHSTLQIETGRQCRHDCQDTAPHH